MTSIIFTAVVQSTAIGHDCDTNEEAIEIVAEGDKAHGHFITDQDSAGSFLAGSKILITIESSDGD
jgi:hypothetical protein